MARNEQLIRQHKILQILERRRYGSTLEELRDSAVEELGLTNLHVRTIRRDLEALQIAGMNIITEDLPAGRVWKLSRADMGLHKITINASELIALSMGRDLLVPLMGTQFWQGIEAFWNKIREQLPAGVWEHYERYRKTLRVRGVPPKTYEKQQGYLKTINRAIQEHRIVEVDYEPTGKPVATRLLEPYGLVLFHGSIYIVAMEEGRELEKEPEERLKYWKLDRFTKATALDRWFKYDESVDLDAFTGQSVGMFSGDSPITYKIKLSSRAARWVQEEPWHTEQKIEPLPDGTCILSVPGFGGREIYPSVMKLGLDAELMEPPEAREEIKGWIEEMAKLYR